jgi:hypothetical protein
MSGNIFAVLSCQLFAAAYSQLCLLQLQNACISFEDIVEVVRLVSGSVRMLSKPEILTFSGIIYEATLKPVYSDLFGAKLDLKREISLNEDLYFREVIRTLEERKKLVSSLNAPEIEMSWAQFLRDVEEHLQRVRSQENSYSERQSVNNEPASYYGKSTQNDFQPFPSHQESHSFSHPQPVIIKPNKKKFNVMKHEGIIQFLTHIRNSGMDVFFPPILHEKVIFCKTLTLLVLY